MRLKYFSVLLLAFLFILFNQRITLAAVTPVTYINPVRVEVDDYNTGVTTNGFYQIKNLSNNETYLLKPGLSINLQKSSNYLASFGAYSISSNNGFELNEVSGASQYVTFSGKKGAKRNAVVTDPDVVIYDNGEAAEYVGTYSAKGQNWYLIKAKNGNQLAVLVDKNCQLVSAPIINTIVVNTIKSNFNEFRGSIKYIPSSDSSAKPQLINVLDMQSYLKGVVPNEMPASWHINALKSQAVAARSYAYIKNQRSVLSNTTSSQVYNGYRSEYSQSNKAIDETNEQYVKYNNKVIETFFYSTSGGRTASVGDVWNSNQSSFPYLVSVEDKYENSPNYSNWTRSYSSRTILDQFGFGTDDLLTDIIPIQTKVYGNSGTTTNGEITGITLVTTQGSKTLRGNELYIRKLFPTDGSYGFLPSNWFVIQAMKQFKIQTANNAFDQFGIKGASVQLTSGVTKINSNSVQINSSNSVLSIPSDPPSINLVGKGFGHRIGMSQYGAKGYAENGWTYQQILTHYFTGTTVGGL